MEIEAKFAVPNRAVYRELAHLRMLAGYMLVAVGVAQVADRYFDTADGRLLTGGYACRLRAEGDALIATLKGIGGVQGAVHRRAEEEVRLSEWSPDPGAWPPSAARTLALDLAAGALLEPLFGLEQRRARADIFDGERRVAQLSLDHVRLDLTGVPRAAGSTYYELEVELASAGTEADLASIAADLSTAWHLIPEPHSKFARAFAIVRERKAAVGLLLSPDERRTLEAHAADSDSPYAHRAAAVLGKADGLGPAAIIERSQLSAGRARYWVREFRAKRLGFLAEGAESEPRTTRAAPRAAPPPQTSDTTVSPPPSVPPEPAAAAKSSRSGKLSPAALLSIGEFCRHYGVDLPHARFVVAQVHLLFDALKRVHKLPKKSRGLLRSAAMLATVGATTDPAHPNQAGRDLILTRPLRGVSTAERLTLACIVAFSAGKVRADREPTLAALDEKMRGQVVALAALVRLAEALDFSRTQTSEIEAFEDADGDTCVIVVAGPSAALDAAQAQGQADLWYQTFKQELIFAVSQPASEVDLTQEKDDMGKHSRKGPKRTTPAATRTASARVATSIAPPAPAALPIIEYTAHGGRRSDERGRPQSDLSAFHQDAGQRSRHAAGRGFRGAARYARGDAAHARGLRAVWRAFRREDAQTVRQRAAPGRSHPGRSARSGCAAGESAGARCRPPAGERGFARSAAGALGDRPRCRRAAQMLDYLDGSSYREFVADFGAFLTTPGAGAPSIPDDEPVPFQVRHVAPSLIITHYESVRAFERLLPGAPLLTYHALRIDCKGLRYALEFFRDLLGDEAPALIKQVTGMQDLLGELQDAHVAEALLDGFLRDHRKAAREAAGRAVAGRRGSVSRSPACAPGRACGGVPRAVGRCGGPGLPAQAGACRRGAVIL